MNRRTSSTSLFGYLDKDSHAKVLVETALIRPLFLHANNGFGLHFEHQSHLLAFFVVHKIGAASSSPRCCAPIAVLVGKLLEPGPDLTEVSSFIYISQLSIPSVDAYRRWYRCTIAWGMECALSGDGSAQCFKAVANQSVSCRHA